jgi:hypothetical protein
MINNFFSKRILLFVCAVLVFGTSQIFAGVPSDKLSRVNDLTKSKSADKANSKKSTGPSVSTEKAAYIEGETVKVNGSGFKSFEAITVSVERDNKLRNQAEMLANWTVYADQNGSVNFEWYAAFSATYKVKLTGDESKAEAVTTFVARTVSVVDGNPKCSDFGNYAEFKIEPPRDGTYTFTNGGGATINVDFYGGENGLQFVDFNSDRFFSVVIVKGANNANVYSYNPAQSSDTGLTTPTLQDISHVSFCVQEGPPPTPASITIIKDAQPATGQAFNFTANRQIPANFSLTDNGNGVSDRVTYSNLTGFGAANSVKVTELPASEGYRLIDISCSSNGTGAEDNSYNPQAGFVDIVLQPGENVVCTFTNAVTTAAPASVSGLVLRSNQQGMARTYVTITNMNTMERQTTMTNAFGRFRFNNLEVGEVYTITVGNKKIKFDQPTRSFVLNGNLDGLTFTALNQ